MTGKVLQGMTFGGLVNYLKKEMNKSEILGSDGICTASRDAIRDSFNMQYRNFNCALKNPVGHISLSWHKNDAGKLDNDIMLKVAKEYMERMNIKNTQYMVVRHYDRQHPHLHILYNRVSNDGTTISDSNERWRNVKACKAITRKYGFYFGKGKDGVNISRLKGKEKMKYIMREKVMRVLNMAHSWQEFKDLLNNENINIYFRSGKEGKGIVGIVFADNMVSFAGGKLDPKLKFRAIDNNFGNVLESASYTLERDSDLPLQTKAEQGILPKTTETDSTFIHHLPSAILADNDASASSSGQGTADEPDKDWTLITLDVVMDMLLQTQGIEIGGGGGGQESDLSWGDEDDDIYDDKLKVWRPRRGR